MVSLTGEFWITLDDKSRLSLPARLRNAVADTTMFLTRGMEKCLWLYPSDKWKEIEKAIMDTTNPFLTNSRNIRRFFGPVLEVEIDKAGRIPVAESLREFAGLAKDCVVLGQFDYIEIWANDRYQAYLAEHEEEFISGSEELGNLLKGNKDIN